MEARVQGLVKSSVSGHFAGSAQDQSDTVDPEPPSGRRHISSDSDQEDHFGTAVLNELLMAQGELEDFDSFALPVVTKTPLWKLAEQSPRALRLKLRVQPTTSTPAKPAAPQVKAPAQAKPQAPTQAQMRPPAPALPPRPAPAYLPQPQATPPQGG